MNTLLDYLLLFSVGSILGWVCELFFRKIVHGKWVNPGFLYGPYLPLYGFGICSMHLLTSIHYVDISFWQGVIAILFAGVAMTLVEYIAGLIFVKKMKIKLWDYSKRPGNIQGIICPLFSFIWLLVVVAYYFGVAPYVNGLLEWFHINIIVVNLFVGMFYGIFAIDFACSINLATKIRKFAKEQGITVAIEDFKLYVKKRGDEIKQRIPFLNPLRSGAPLIENLQNYKKASEEALQNYKKLLEQKLLERNEKRAKRKEKQK